MVTIKELSDLAVADPVGFIRIIRTAEATISADEKTTRDTALAAALISVETELVANFDPLLIARDLRKTLEDQRLDVLSNLKLIEAEIAKRNGVTDAEKQAYSIKLKERFASQETVFGTIRDEKRADKEV